MLINQAPTAIKAFHSDRVQRICSGQAHDVLVYLEQHGGDIVIAEYAAITGIDKSSVSRAFRELLDAKKVVECEPRKSRITGIMSRPVKLPPGQADLF